MAIIDTGGGYEVMLRERFGLKVIDIVEVLAFGGKELVELTEGFAYEAGGVRAVADAALVGLSVCDCNGLGFHFLRKTGVVLGLDFSEESATFQATLPDGGILLPFTSPPAMMDGFDSAFVEVDVGADGVVRTVLGLLDTGTNRTVMRRGLVGSPSTLAPNHVDITIQQEDLGTVAARVALFDTSGLPDLIIGTDVMRAWGERWYFFFGPRGGAVTIFPAGPAVEVTQALPALRQLPGILR